VREPPDIEVVKIVEQRVRRQLHLGSGGIVHGRRRGLLRQNPLSRALTLRADAGQSGCAAFPAILGPALVPQGQEPPLNLLALLFLDFSDRPVMPEDLRRHAFPGNHYAPDALQPLAPNQYLNHRTLLSTGGVKVAEVRFARGGLSPSRA